MVCCLDPEPHAVLQAYCCWNGMVKLRAEPFRQGLRFRTHFPGECSASECSLLCDDYHRLGYNKVLIDPSIKLTYSLGLMRRAKESFTAWGTSSWHQVTQAPAVTWQDLNYTNVECCDLAPGQRHVNFQQDCHFTDITATNYTQQALQQEL